MYIPKIKLSERGRGEGTVSIVTETEDKVHPFSFFKRRRLGDITSVTFGYKQREGGI